MIVAVDPGKMSGLAYFEPRYAVGDPARFQSWQEPTWVAVRWVDRYLKFTAVEAVVCEDYVITMQTLKKTRGENWSLESIGALRYFCLEAEVRFELQKSGDGLGFGTRPKLERAGWWNPTSGGHANAAASHLMLYLANTGRLDLVLSRGPSGGGNVSSSPD